MTPDSKLRVESSGGSTHASAAAPQRQTEQPAIATLELAVERAARHLLNVQDREGYWWAELEADTTLESDYIPYLHVLGLCGRQRSDKVPKLAQYVRERQLPDGGWNIFYGGPAELNATVKAYVGLRLAGDPASAPHMEAAKRKIHELGGLEATNSYVRFYMAMFGAIDWRYVPAIPPELMLIPEWMRLSIFEMSSWTRAIVIPMTVICSMKPNWRMPEGIAFDELFKSPGAKPPSLKWDGRIFSWRTFFLFADRLLKLYEHSPWKPTRKIALAKAWQWTLDHLERSEGLGTIYPAMMNSIYALLAVNPDANDPLAAREIGHLERFEIEERDTIRVQPCISPVWDTAIVMVSLEEAGVDPSHPAMVKAAGWLIENQILGSGDWQVKNKKAEAGGWAFEFRNDFFPDVDDTAFVLMALARVAYPDSLKMRKAVARGLAWLLSMQNGDGGWGAFDHENNRQFLNNIPFADHNAMLDPSTADVTARVLECVGQMGWPASHPIVERARAFLRHDQRRDGSWFGRWGVNYIYGTSGVLRALETVNLSKQGECQRAANWLRSVQNADGGFGESILSYADPSLKGQGKSTASQTAWALIGLLAVVGPNDPAVERAVAWLLEHQTTDGAWDEAEFTGTGFPCVFYLKYHYYRNAFPLYALARYDNMRKGRDRFIGTQVRAEELKIGEGIRG
ncbi:MAG: squalene--hopene cyclase [Candidatus Acidiferrales bacterium]